jgi:hypothetical protein
MNLISNCFLPYQADFTLCLTTKSKQKSQGCVRFSRKNYVQSAKIPKPASVGRQARRSSSNSRNFLTPPSLVFRLTEQGLSPKFAYCCCGRYIIEPAFFY